MDMDEVAMPPADLPIDDALITGELATRPSREPNYKAESRALGLLAQELASNPDGVLQTLVELVVELCHADSAGVSILEPGGENGEQDIVRWHAIAGPFAPNRWSILPRDASPCGTVIHRDAVLLFSEPGRIFPELGRAEPRIYEGLLAPWHANGAPIGTLWAVTHTPDGRFDGEDARLLERLARFAAAAWQTHQLRTDAETARADVEQRVAERTSKLEAVNAALRTMEGRYDALFQSLDQGFCTIEVAFDEDDRPTDYRFLEVSPSFERQTGIVNGAGRWMREIAADQDEYWFDVYGHVALTREPERFEYFSTPLDRWWSVYAFPIDDPATRRIGVLFNDITERKHAEETLRESQDRFRALVTASSYVTYSMSPDWSEMYELRGQGFLADAEASTDWLTSYIHPDDQAWVTAAIHAAIESKQMFELEHRVLRADGTPGWTLSRAVPLLDADGAITSWFGAASDVTDRRTAEEELRRSEARMRLAVEANRTVAWEWDPATDHITASDNFAEVYGLPALSGVADGFALVHPDDLPMHQAHVERVVRDGGEYHSEFRIVRPVDGQTAWLEERAAALTDAVGGVTRLVGVVTDVTERKQAETTLRASEERLLLAMEAGNQFGWEVDRNTQIATFSGDRQAVLGFDMPESRDARWSFVHPEDVELGEEAYRKAIETGTPFSIEQRLIPPGDEEKIVWVRVDGGIFGTPPKFVGMTRNITEQKEAEQALQESEERYRTLFETMDQGFCTIERIETVADQSSDYRYVDVNPAFARHTGMRDVVGKTILDLVPDAEHSVMDIYDDVVRTGRQRQFEAYVEALDLWMEAEAFPAQRPGQIAVLFSNVSQRKRSEEALRASEERFRQFAEASTDVLWVRDAATLHLEFISLAFEECYGVSRDDLLDGDDLANWACLLHPDDRQRVLGDFERVRAGERVTHEFRIVRPDGDIRWLRDTDFPLIDEAARVERIGGITEDITIRKQIEQALRESEERHRLIVEAAHDYAILTTDPNGIIESWSPGAEAVFGWTDTDAIGQSVEVTYTAEDRANGEPERERNAAAHTGFAPNVRWHQRQDGTQVFLDGVVRPLDDGGGHVRGFLKIGQDVTERRRTEEALRESEARFRAVADLVPDLLWSNDPAGEADWYNRRWLEYTGQTPDEAGGNGWLDTIHPEDRGISLVRFQSAIATGIPLRLEHRMRRYDGEYQWFLVQAMPVRDEDGVVVRWFGAATDIHEQRIAREDLEARVVAATTELRDLSRRLLQVQEQERRYLANELHDEIGQSLTGLNFTLAMARRSELEGASEHLERAAAISQGLLEQVRHLSLDLRPSVLDDMGLLPALTVLIERMWSRTGLVIELRHEGADRRFPPNIETTAYRVVQEALTNVVRHAGVDQASVQILVDGSIAIWISDSGRGFDSDVVQASDTSTGLLGMAERVRLVGGAIQIESAPGEGTTVVVDLPHEPGTPIVRGMFGDA